MTLQAGGGRRNVSVGNYRFTGRRLGKGNFAKVEEATHTVLNVKSSKHSPSSLWVYYSMLRSTIGINDNIDIKAFQKLYAFLKRQNVGNVVKKSKVLSDGEYKTFLIKARDEKYLLAKVAIKIMDVSTIKEEYVVRNLFREAKIMARLSHPCIAALFQTMQYGNIYYLVTELVGGGDLCNFIKSQRNGRLEEHCTRIYARQLISAISHMHNLDIVHSELFLIILHKGDDKLLRDVAAKAESVEWDLKMENVMLNMANDMIKIVDFGLSNIYSPESPLKTHCGSPEYAAPELFVEGKHYGPEVDLWSLGVILYGMVVGQLPFVSTVRDGHVVSHQLRRKKLLEQINKGLSAPHRKALALFTTEFRSMMSRLLIADSCKRINITELIFHPWVTEKGRKSVRSNPLQKLDEHTQTNVAKEVALLTNCDLAKVQHAIKAEPHGNIAGIYNLITYKKMIGNLEVDPVTSKNLTPHYATPRPSVCKIAADSLKYSKRCEHVKRPLVLKSAPVRVTSQINQPPVTPSRTDANGRSSALTKPVMEKSDHFLPALKPKARYSPSKPISVPKNNGINFIPLRMNPSRKCNISVTSDASAGDNKPKTPAKKLTSRPISRSANTKISNDKEKRVSTPNLLRNLHRTPAGDAPHRSSNYDTYQDLVYTIAPPTQNTRGKKNVVNQITPTPKKPLRTYSATAQPMPTEIPRRQSVVGPIHTAERAAKRRSMLPVLTSKRTSRSIASAGPALTPCRNQKVVMSDRRGGLPDRSDDFKKPISSPVKCLMDFSNEPIARSIAGYVAKNVSNKMESLKWIKGAKINLNT